MLVLTAAVALVSCIDDTTDDGAAPEPQPLAPTALVTTMPVTTVAPPTTIAPVTTVAPATTVPEPGPPTRRAAVLTAIGALVVAEPYLAQPYRRAAFGDGWIDADRDCHNTRAEVLMSESTADVTFNPNGCTVATGRWVDPWSGFTSTAASDFEIDHTIPLADAWRSGAWAWDDARRLAFANDLTDPDMLNPLQSRVNISKGDRTPDAWRPPERASWCRYAESWARIKRTWALSVTARERDALVDLAASCDD